MIPIPPGCQGCMLELSILNFFGPVRSRGENPTPFKDYYPNWILFKIPELTLVNSYGKAIDGNDIEYKSWLNSSAKEEKKIETIVGTPRTSANFGMDVDGCVITHYIEHVYSCRRNCSFGKTIDRYLV